VSSLEEPITFVMRLTTPQARLKTGENANNALESHTASVSREPTSEDLEFINDHA